ncbi:MULTISPECIES: hypothetical protein [unclassified Pseudofrankia]|uniref:hypothetical protein n=1 Tax=unclassified Pseudofrankia TaxID=2994372 RepID=UPI0008DAC2C8|nr:MULTISPECIES: hypothetical protein [unclassified Pseudofrankia]MDT3445488.1 hypothetical protein [Pseudofrankia sp. BMG5.37]OHV71562.1 hypothetical protein BCD48_34445 [Pseudofrankia sp. BMG5.36]
MSGAIGIIGLLVAFIAAQVLRSTVLGGRSPRGRRGFLDGSDGSGPNDGGHGCGGGGCGGD